MSPNLLIKKAKRPHLIASYLLNQWVINKNEQIPINSQYINTLNILKDVIK